MSESVQTRRIANAAPSSMAWFAAGLSLLPLFLYAYLGHFSRLMIDDYAYFATAFGLGFRHYFEHWWQTWHGSYSYFVFHDLLSPLDPARIPSLFPGLTIALWLIGLTWLLSIALRHLGVRRLHLPIAIALAALTVHASIMSFHTWESIYWYASSSRHTFPVGIMLLFLGFALDIAKRLRTNIHLLAAATAGALICFVSGGFSELNVAFQLICLPLLLGIVAFAAASPGRRAQVAVLAAGFCGSVVSAMAHFSAPGIANRLETSAASIPYAKVIRDIPSLMLETLRSSLEYFGHQGSILGFMLLLATGLVAALLLNIPTQLERRGQSLSLPWYAPLLGLLVQLAFLPTLWTDLGALAFNVGYELYLAVGIAVLNTAMMLAYPIVIGFRRSIESCLAGRIEYATPLAAAIMLGVFVLLAMTQLTVLPYRISIYLFANALVLLVILSRILDSIAADYISNRLRSFAFLSLALAAIVMALTLAIGHFGLGYIYLRSLALAALTQVLPGLAFGAYIGVLIQRCRPFVGANAWYSERFIIPGIIIVFSIVILDMTAQARLIPDFATFAREWDARHEHIIQMRENGVRDIEIAPFSFDLSGYISASGQAFGESHPYYYGVDSITVVK